MAQLHRNNAKLSSRCEEYENRSTSARNEYIFQLTALNAHFTHYLKTDIPDIAKILDGDVFEKFRGVLSSSGKSEYEICCNHQEAFRKVFEESTNIDRSKAWEQFLKQSPIFHEDVNLIFEPRPGDTISGLLSLSSKSGGFQHVANKLARHFVSRERRIRLYEEEIEELRSGNLTAPPGQANIRKFSLKDFESNSESLAASPDYVEHKIEELLFAIRREEIEKTKNQACLDLLSQSSVDVKGALNEAYLASAAIASADCREAKRDRRLSAQNDLFSLGLVGYATATITGSSTEESLEAVGNQRCNGRSSLTSAGPSTESWSKELQKSLSFSDAETPRLQPPADIRHSDEVVSSPKSSALSLCMTVEEQELQWTDGGRLCRATALYEFLSSRPDEIDLVVNEKVALLGTGDGEHWVKVRSLIDGKEGLVPRNFLVVYPQSAADGGDNCFSSNPSSASSYLESMNNADVEKRHSRLSVNNGSLPALPIANPSALQHPPMSSCPIGQFVRALISYDGCETDELSFAEGDIIHVLGQPAADVDDGWLDGELMLLSPAATVLPSPNRACKSSAPGHLRRGVFSSMFVQQLSVEETRLWRDRLNQSIDNSNEDAKSQSSSASTRPVDADLISSLGITASSVSSSAVKPRRPPSSSSGSGNVFKPGTSPQRETEFHGITCKSPVRQRQASSGRRAYTHNDEHRSRRQQQPHHRPSSHRRVHHAPSQHHKTQVTSQTLPNKHTPGYSPPTRISGDTVDADSISSLTPHMSESASQIQRQLAFANNTMLQNESPSKDNQSPGSVDDPNLTASKTELRIAEI